MTDAEPQNVTPKQLGKTYTEFFDAWQQADHEAAVARHNWRIKAEEVQALLVNAENKEAIVLDLTKAMQEFLQVNLQKLAALNTLEVKP